MSGWHFFGMELMLHQLVFQQSELISISSRVILNFSNCKADELQLNFLFTDKCIWYSLTFHSLKTKQNGNCNACSSV